MRDQELAGGGRWNRGGKARGGGGNIARATASTEILLPASADTSAFSAAQVESAVEAAFNSLAAANKVDAGSHGAEKPMEAPGDFSACACAIVKPSATMRAKPKAMPRHLRSTKPSYTHGEGYARGSDWGQFQDNRPSNGKSNA